MADNSITKPLYNKSIGQISPISSSPRNNFEATEESSFSDIGTQAVPTSSYSASDLRTGQSFVANQPGMPLDGQEQSLRQRARREENKTGKTIGGILPIPFGVPFMASVIVIALFIDFLEFWVLGLLGLFTGPIAGLFFWYMFKRQGVDMRGRSRRIIIIAGPFINVIPGLSAIPGGWTVEVLAVIASVYLEQKILKESGSGKIGAETNK